MLTVTESRELLAEVAPFFIEEGLKRGEILLQASTEGGYTVKDLLREHGVEQALRFLMADATLDTQRVTRLRAESIHARMLEMKEQILHLIPNQPNSLSALLSSRLRASQRVVEIQLLHVTNFIEKVHFISEWLESRTPLEAYSDLMHSDAFGSYDKCARLYLKFVGHPSLGLGLVANWKNRLSEFPIIIDGAIARLFLTTGIIQPFLRDWLGSEENAREYLEKIATFQGYDAKYVCAIALVDPIHYALMREFKVSDTLAFENGMWRFSRKGGLCPNNPAKRVCKECIIARHLEKLGAKCEMMYRAYGGPRFAQVCQNYIDYQKDVVCVCVRRAEECFQETFEKLFDRPLSPSLVKDRFARHRTVPKFVHLLPKRRDLATA